MSTPSPKSPKAQRREFLDNRVRELNAKGLNDALIAQRLAMSKRAVESARRRMGLAGHLGATP